MLSDIAPEVVVGVWPEPSCSRAGLALWMTFRGATLDTECEPTSIERQRLNTVARELVTRYSWPVKQRHAAQAAVDGLKWKTSRCWLPPETIEAASVDSAEWYAWMRARVVILRATRPAKGAC